MEIKLRALNLDEYVKLVEEKDKIEKEDVSNAMKFAKDVKALIAVAYPKVDISKIAAGTAFAIFRRTWELTNEAEEEDLKNLKGSGNGTTKAEPNIAKIAEK